jgi:Ca-activated chloride channel family protein
MLRFAHPQFLHLLWLVPALAVFYYLAFRWKRSALERFGNLALVDRLIASTSRTKQILKASLLVASLLFMSLALARPQIGTRLEEVKREGIDLMIALDVSASMLAEDIKPNRLEKAKHEVASLINKLDGDRVGIIAFAGEAFVQCPLTLDYGAAKIFLDILDTQTIPVPGTAIGAAIGKAVQSFESQERKYKVLILITDGEDHEGNPVEAAERAAQEGVVIYTVGIGSPKGVPIPLFDERGNRIGFKKDRKGQVVTTKLDELTLEKIALATNGKYYRATTGEVELERIYEEISKMEKKELASLKFSQYEDRFQYVLGLAIVFLVAESLIGERRRQREVWRGRFV